MAHTLLFVDDEENILKALRRLFHRTGHEILLAPGGEQALELLRSRPVSVIVSDQRMPGMSGAELLERARQLRPEAVRIMLTGYSDIHAAMQAINDGQVYRFLTKPWDDQALLDTVAAALADLDLRREHEALQEQVRRQNAELKELNETLERKVLQRTEELQQALGRAQKLNESLRQQNLAVVKSFANLIDLRNQQVGGHCRRVAAWVQPVCARLGIADPQQVQPVIIAALLHDLGKIALSDALLQKRPAELGREEREELRRHPIVGQGQLQVLEGMAEVGRIVRHHHEHVDGSGYPDGLAGDEIPLGARVIRLLDAYDHLAEARTAGGHGAASVLQTLDRHVNRHFDEAAFDALTQVLRTRTAQYDASKERRVTLDSLEEGMVLSRDLRTLSGLLLVPQDEPLTSSHLEKIRNLRRVYPTDAYAFVYRG
ncbi:MAG: two-component system response regulator [Deferrisomatales bacterium]